MHGLSTRQQLLLGLVVREFVSTARPVGSKALVDHFALEMSPATVRHELAALEELGYLRQPHTSAGRVPTEEGYRYFVQRLVGDNELPPTEQRMISHQFHQSPLDLDQWMRLSAAVLARASRNAAIITWPSVASRRLKHVELIAVQGRLVLLVVVLQGGAVHQQMLTLAEPVRQERLHEVTDMLNRLGDGPTADDLLARTSSLPPLESEIGRLVADLLGRGEGRPTEGLYHDGLENVLQEPEFGEGDNARHALKLLEERGFLEHVLDEALNPSIGVVQVLIGGEGRWEGLRDFSLVLSRYGSMDLATGTLGVLGPVRMAYGRSISAVRYVAGLLSNLIIDMYSDEMEESEHES